MNRWANLCVTDGTDQDDRISAALQPGYFNVDERTFEALLAMGAEFAAKVNYYNLNNEIDGSWAELFSADEAVIMAMILCVDLKQIEAEFQRLHADGVAALALYVLHQSQRFNFWITKLHAVEHGAGETLASRITALVEEKLILELHTLGAIVTRLEIDSGSAGFAAFSPLWGVEREGEQYRFPRSVSDLATDEDATRQQLRRVFYAFFNAISYLKSITPIYLQESLGSQLHNPATGLYMTFLKLYQRAQEKINSFTQRHLDFYYERLLGVTPRVAQPESLYLRFELAAGTRRALIGKGTEFTAGRDEALKEIVYRGESDLLLNDARVVSLRTLCLQHDKLLSPEYELGYVSRIKANQIRMPATDLDESELQPWPLFGGEKPGVTTDSATNAMLGFAVESTVLLLSEGERRVELTIIMADLVSTDAAVMVTLLGKSESEAAFIKLFGRLFSRYLFNGEGWLSDQQREEITALASALLSKISADEIAALMSEGRIDLFYKLFKKIFILKLTGSDGWVEVVDYLVTPLPDHGGEMGFRLEFVLGPEMVAITRYDCAVHGSAFEATQPLLQCSINPQSNFYPYSSFNDLLLKQVAIEVDVVGLRSIQVHNNHGQLDPSKPFLPFGPLPSSNSYLVCGAHEIAVKTVLDLSVVLEWAELPSDRGGFESYYCGYDSHYQTESFNIDFSTLADGDWQPRDQTIRQPQRLFESDVESGRVAGNRRLHHTELKYARSLDASLPAAAFSFGVGAREGFFKLSLVEPATAFGHRDYPVLLTRVLSENARTKKPLPIPNPPYTPTLNRLSLDYRAKAVVEFTQGRVTSGASSTVLHHIHPFGIERFGADKNERRCFMLPQYGDEGNLFIGIAAQALAGPLTLFFHLSQDMAEEVGSETRDINWFYLAKNCWKPFDKKALLSDSSDGFLTSGIVTLTIPDDINSDNTVMPAGLYWLRASTRNEPLSFCSLYSVQSHALKLTRLMESDRYSLSKMAVAKKWQAMVSIPGVGRIVQAGKVIPGRAHESRQQLITRVSERLHHKNRASTPWDYERLILQQFPNVFKVKCFSNMAKDGRYPAPGHLLIVVVPYLHKAERQGGPRAMMNSLELSRIRRFVQSLATTFATIDVRNPAYEQIQVRCSIKFRNEAVAGYYLNQLERAISDYINPWEKIGYSARFGWGIRQKDIESYIRGLDYIEYVTNFSMLHITEDGKGGYHLYDTADAKSAPQTESDNSIHDIVIRNRAPWSLAVPARHQFIEVVQESRPITALTTGVDELEIGGTFIINGNSDYGQEE